MRGLTDWEYSCLNSDWIKVAGWDRTFSDEERRLLETFKGCSSSLCQRAWLAQRQYRLSHDVTLAQANRNRSDSSCRIDPDASQVAARGTTCISIGWCRSGPYSRRIGVR